MHRATLSVLFAVLLGSPAFAASAADNADPVALSPEQIGQIFCIGRVADDMGPVEGLLTSTLKQAIAKADTLETSWQKHHPGEKPPLGDGLPWQSEPDYTADCTVGTIATMANDAKVSIDYKFDGAPSGNYSDTLLLKSVIDAASGTKVWRIDNVGFDQQSSMRQLLIDAFKP